MVTALAVQMFAARNIFGLEPLDQLKAWFPGIRLSAAVLAASLGIRWLHLGSLASLLLGGLVCVVACGVGVMQLRVFQEVRERMLRRA